MKVVNGSSLATGLALSAGFLVVLALIFAPMFGGERNGLEYADDVFNRLSKGSSYFIPKVSRQAAPFAGTPFAATLRIADGQEELAQRLLAAAGAEVRREGGGLAVAGDLGKLLGAVLHDAEAGYRNQDDAFAARYGSGGREALATWWHLLRQLSKALVAQRHVDQADAVTAAVKKAVEPAHNYFGVEAESVGDMPWTMSALLAFYVLYTVWWGSAIYYLFEGVGLVMRRG